MLKPANWIVVALLILLVGCGAPRPRSTSVSKTVPRDLILTEPAKPVAPQAAPTNPVPAQISPVPTNTFSLPKEDWISLGRWAGANRAGTLTNLPPVNGHRSFGLITSQGQFVVRTDSSLAQWNGLEVRLGFELKLIEEQPFIHRLDLEKNIIPLLLKTPAFTPGTRVVVLDPGHGGNDSGTRSAEGDLEKDYTLDWALRLKTLLEDAGWKVFLTRAEDATVSLTDRVAFADEQKADLFLSLHFNATGQPHHAGIETYCVTPTGMPSNVTRGYEDNAALIFPNNQFDAQNLQLALTLHRAVLRATGGNDRGVRRARFLTVLRGQNRPAALIEGGYLSNPEEAARIDTEEYRQLLAEAVAKALQ